MQNQMKTVLLLGTLTGLFMLIGSALGGTGGMMFAFFFAVMMNMGAWWFSDSLALRMSGAQEAPEAQFPELHRMVAQLARNANLPKPRVYVINSPMANAFATGRSPEQGAVAVTLGIMELLNADELAGVIAHELAHIKNRDTLISSLAATLGGAISMIADMAMWGMMFGGFGGQDDEEEGGGVGGMVGGILTLILAPIVALLIQMGISRSREFIADEDGAKILGDPLPLARALTKLEGWSQRQMQAGYDANVRPATAHMYILNPLSAGGVAGLFSTHPSTQERVARLEAMAQQRPLGQRFSAFG